MHPTRWVCCSAAWVGRYPRGLGYENQGYRCMGMGAFFSATRSPTHSHGCVGGRIGRYGVHATDEVGAVVDIGQG